MEKNYYVYYATEENAFETEKRGACTESEALAEAKKLLDEYMDTDDISESMDELLGGYENGVSVVFEDAYKGYTMIVGIAPKGKTDSIEKAISEMRDEIVNMFEEEEEDYGELD